MTNHNRKVYRTNVGTDPEMKFMKHDATSESIQAHREVKCY